MEIIKLLTDAKGQTHKFVFNPLTFHHTYCYFSPQYKVFSGKMDALDIFKQTQPFSDKPAVQSLKLIKLKYMRQKQVVENKIIE